MAVGGALLRTSSTLVRALQLLAAVLVLGITSYFLAVLTDRNLSIATWVKAVEGIAGAAVIYTAFAVILTCFLGGVAAFAYLAILLDILFVGAFVAVAILARGGARSCSGNVSTPLGTGNADTGESGFGGNFGFGSGNNTTYAPNLGQACKLEKAVFAAAIAAAILFLISAVLQFLLHKHHQKEKKYGPGPSNNYTSGTGKKPPFWKRNKKTTHDTELGTVAPVVLAEEKHRNKHHSANSALRPSHDTAMTGSTAAVPDNTYGGHNTKYAHDPTPHVHTAAPHTHTAAPQLHNDGYQSRDTGRVIIGHDNSPGPEVHNNGFPHIEPGVNPGYVAGSQGYNQTTYGRTNY
ncbi:hypothetical protein MMC24_005927 [Lignoscripta atroalba]|nr:hypothetical protein [Lignoscripta atroalba]